MSENNSSIASQLCTAFDGLLKRDFGHITAPDPFVTKTGIRHLDALLGGGLTSSLPICFSSTPETGKSTIALQMASNFLREHPNGIAIYLDIEGAASNKQSQDLRLKDFGIQADRFIYKPVVANLEQVFDIIKSLVEMKKKVEEARNEEYKVFIIWDSIAATPSSKDELADDPNKVIGYKARELTHLINANKTLFAMNRLTIIIVDQIRSHMKIEGPFVKQDEKTVGEFNNYKSATNAAALHHAYSQWLYLSKGTILTPNVEFGIDGWVLHIHVEKNKLKSSGYNLPVVFDRKYGVIPLLSEYYFMREMSKLEVKLTKKNASKLPYPLAVGVEGRSKVITVVNPDTGEIIAKTEKFSEKNIVNLYYNDPNFRQVFDTALEYSIQERIIKGLFRDNVSIDESASSLIEEDEETTTDAPFDSD